MRRDLIASLLPPANPDDRWNFVRDVMVFQLKLFLDNVRDLVRLEGVLKREVEKGGTAASVKAAKGRIQSRQILLARCFIREVG